MHPYPTCSPATERISIPAITNTSWEFPGKILRLGCVFRTPFLHADRIKTPTLFLCGQNDLNVPLLNAEQMYQALRSLGVPTELVIYPGQFHGLKKPSYIIDRYKRYLDWYGKWITSASQPRQ